MKKMLKILIVAIVAICIIVGAGVMYSGALGSNDAQLDGQEIKLAAAASLKNVYDNELIPMFEEKYGDVKVSATYGSSGDLQTQIENGLDADVFMSAATKQMDALIDEDLIDKSTNVESLENKVVLIIPKESKSDISSFEDLKNVKGVIAIGDPESVPAGQYAKEVLTNLNLWDSVQSKLSLGTDVTAVLNQVAQGSADCGIVYKTDAVSTDDVKIVCEAPSGSLKTPVIYPVAMVKSSKHPEASKAFIDFLQTQEAKDVFVKYGFTIH
ncbi:MAG: molybdate ABC transporter substrate-binding protein [archaeon]|nr:molybdate ABC transporter substrate-binding protein [archaeon]